MSDDAAGGHLAGAYHVVCLAAGSPLWMPEQFGVQRAVSGSAELVRVFPRPPWADDFAVSAAEFGLDPPEHAPAGHFVGNLMAVGGFGWPDVFFAVEDALRFRSRFAPGRDDVAVIGIGLVDEHATQFLTGLTAALQRLRVPSQVGMFGVSQMLERREVLAAGGRVLGYELLGMEVPPLTSWAVHDLPLLVHERLGISVNSDGLIDVFDDACRAAAFVSRPDVPSEPVDWMPWMIVEYA